jgi:2-dehydro-3-deoxygluconokinase
MNIRKDCKYALIAPTSMGVRITPVNRQPVHTSRLYEMHATSAETNVLNVSASLGLPVKALTAFVKGSPIAEFIKSELRARNIDYEGMEVVQEGPWGVRHQFNIADAGFGPRAPRVHNDRAGEVGRMLDVNAFDLDRIFREEGCAILHVSGLVAALSPGTSDFCLELARTAKKHGSLVSFDLNYRASFWKDRKEELSAAFAEIASLSDILIGNEEDFQLALGIKGPDAGGKGLRDNIDAFRTLIGDAKERFPNAQVFATTLREVISANRHLWGAILRSGDEWHVVEPREIEILDRIGGGDGFVGGVLYSILRGWTPDRWVRFGWATGALAATLLTDYASPIDEAQVWSIYEGNARVVR